MPSKFINPFTEDGGAWDALVLAGVRFEGVVKVTGTPWKKRTDHRRARGRNGARAVGAGWDLGEWTIELTAWEDAHIDVLGELIDAVTRRDATQDAAALPIEHPAFAVAGVSQVLFEEGEAPEVTATKVVWTFRVKEYRPPEPRDVTRAPAPAEQQPETGGRFVEQFDAQPSLAARRPTPPSSDP